MTYLSAAPGSRLPLPHLIAVTLLALPWLWPFASGPTPAVLPQLVSLACGALFLQACLARPGNLSGLFARALFIAAVVSSVIALLQYLGASSALTPWVNVTEQGHAFGNLRQRNQLGSLLNMGLAVLVWSAWTRQLRDAVELGQGSGDGEALTPRTGALRYGSLVCAVVLLASANAATSSRTGLVQLATLLLLALVWRRQAAPGTWPILGGAVLAYAIASVLLPLLAGLDPYASGIAARFSGGGQSCESRIILWHNVLQLIAQKPWFGWGWGELDYAHFITVYPGARFCDILDNAHNMPLHLAVELGMPVAIAVCACVAWLVWRARPWRETVADRQTAWAVLAMIALHSMLEYPLWYGPFQIAAALAVWILWRVPAAQRPSGAHAKLPTPAADFSHRPPPVVQWRVTAVAAVLLACMAYVGWDYWRVSQIYRPPEQRAMAYRDGTLRKIQASWLFRNQARFAAVTTTDVNAGNAALINRAAKQLLHFSPEPRVIEKVIASAHWLHLGDEEVFFLERYRAAFPKDYARWRAAHPGDPAPSPPGS
jgi:O-antigen ligase